MSTADAQTGTTAPSDELDIRSKFDGVANGLGDWNLKEFGRRSSIGQFMTSESGTSLRNILTHPWAQMIVGGIGTLMFLKNGITSRSGVAGIGLAVAGFSGAWEDLWQGRLGGDNSRLKWMMDGLRNPKDLAAEGASTGAVPKVGEESRPSPAPAPLPGTRLAAIDGPAPAAGT